MCHVNSIKRPVSVWHTQVTLKKLFDFSSNIEVSCTYLRSIVSLVVSQYHWNRGLPHMIRIIVGDVNRKDHPHSSKVNSESRSTAMHPEFHKPPQPEAVERLLTQYTHASHAIASVYA